MNLWPRNQSNPEKMILRTMAVFQTLFWFGCGVDFGEDRERPEPEFTREDKHVEAKLVPRGKNNSIIIHFSSESAQLHQVIALDFKEHARDQLDVKNFRSGIFEIHLAMDTQSPETNLSICSDYFNPSTKLWIFQIGDSGSWADANALHLTRTLASNKTCHELSIKIKDGSSWDIDQEKNQSLTIRIGPRDDFWAYALGTLLIRFFGVVLVLSVLMIGMLISGKIFSNLEKKSVRSSCQPTPILANSISTNGLSLDQAAAIAMALHLHLTNNVSRPNHPAAAEISTTNRWTHEGRVNLMNQTLWASKQKK